MSNKNFKCTQQELYAVCALGWESFGQNLEKFSTLKPKYNQAYLESRRANLDAVMRMPNHFQRASGQESLRIDLKEQAEKGIRMWKLLQSHIREAFTGERLKAKLKGAGVGFYNEAYNLKWEACHNLLVTGEAFILEHKAELLANDNMDPAFPEAFAQQVKDFKDLYLKYTDRVKLSSISTSEKQEANNKLHRELLSMFTDARILFKGDEAKLKQFNFSAMLNQISGQGGAGVRGFIAGLPEPVDMQPGLELKLLETGKEAMLESDGAYRFSQVAAGAYTLQLKADGYQTLSIPVNVNTGSFTLLNVTMEPETRG